MVSPSRITTLVVALVIGAALLSPVVGVVTDNVGEVTVDEEEFTDVDVGEWYDLDGTNLVEDSETVEYDSGEGWTEASSGTDYEMNYDNGSVQFLEGGDISAGDDVRVSYDYEATDGMTTSIIELIPLFIALFLLVALAAPLINGL